jgi:hypothetical protein
MSKRALVKRRKTVPAGPLAARLWLGLVAALAIMPLVAMWSAGLLVLIGLLPSFAAWLIDREPGRPLTLAVAAANAAGALAVVLDFQTGPGTFSAALSALGDGFTLLQMYGAAAVGWALHLGLPIVANAYLTQADEARRRTLVKRQDALVEAWGPEVAGKAEE